MKIPAFLNAIYSNDLILNACTSHSLAVVSAHIETNKPVFFPEYTDHSVKHIELVLQTAIDLASPGARGQLTSLDAAALTIGVSLHDLGMYLTKDGFESLLTEGSRWKGVDFFDRKSWKELWDDFHSEATRFDGRKLRQLFGSSERPVRPLPRNSAVWQDTDYLLVGEFLRRHHPRLAHEIALYGLPAKGGKAVEICLANSEEQMFLADVAGLIARSHGIDLRTCIDYLQHKYSNRIDPRGSHPIYLAALLRIADYFQIQASRAPTATTEVTAFRSKLSEQEWMVHQSVKDINNTGGDPEAIFVIAEPTNVETFLKLKKWIGGLQKELDQTWAVLGEIYGLQIHTGLNLLGLRIRRVRSNIDNVEEFAKTVSYVPAHVAFEAANADLLKLLVAPLYGDDPGIGIRELFQNSIDAVREFNDTASRRPALMSSLTRYEQEADVTLEVRFDSKRLPEEIIICDRGIGMTSEIVQNYFLRAGASFRQSDAWRREHEDSEGHSRVLRTGRFGVGALAAFLLGDEIEVTTRHASEREEDALTFTARLDDEFISLIRTRAPVGTRIRIKIPKRSQQAIRSLLPHNNEVYYRSGIGHYFLKEPSLIRYAPQGTELKPNLWLPQPDEDFTKEWRWFQPKGFERVFWTYDDKYPSLSSNGIIINQDRYQTRSLWNFIMRPSLSVFDREGSLPVNLQRNGLQAPLPFERELLCSICEDLIAHAIAEGPHNCQTTWLRGNFEGFSRGYDDWPAWLITRDGFLLNEGFLVDQFEPKIMVVSLGGEADLAGWGNRIQKKLGVDGLLAGIRPNVLNDTNPRIKGLLMDALSGYLYQPRWLSCERLATYVPHALVDKVKTLKPGKQVSKALAMLDALPDTNGWKQTNDLPTKLKGLNETIVSLDIDPTNPTIFCVFRVQVETDAMSDPSLAKSLGDRWMKLLGTPVIPFSRESRNRLEAASTEEVKKLLALRRKPDKERREALVEPPE